LIHQGNGFDKKCYCRESQAHNKQDVAKPQDYSVGKKV